MIGVQAWLAHERAKLETEEKLRVLRERLTLLRECRVKWDPSWRENLERLTASTYSQVAYMVDKPKDA